MEHLKREAEAAEPELVPPRAKGGRLVVHAAQVQGSTPLAGRRACSVRSPHVQATGPACTQREGGCFFVPVAQTRWPGDWGLGRGVGRRVLMETKAKEKEKKKKA